MDTISNSDDEVTSNGLAARVAALEQQVSILTGRVAALETEPLPADAEGRGTVSYTGSVRVSEGEYSWTIELDVGTLLAAPPEQLAAVITALGSLPRLQLVRALMEGPASNHQLQEALGFSSPGPLYHHLKELVAAGIVEQRGRNDYRLSPRRIVPTLVILAAAIDIGR